MDLETPERRVSGLWLANLFATEQSVHSEESTLKLKGCIPARR
jgi:hypothetical protein